MKTLKVWLSVFGILSLVLGAVACGVGEDEPGATEEDEPVAADTPDEAEDEGIEDEVEDAEPSEEIFTIRLGTQGDFPTHEPLTTAREAGYFEEEGLDIEITNVGSESACVLAIVADSLDVCVPTPENVVRAQDAGASDVYIIAGLGQPAVHGVVSLPEVTSFEQVRGESVAVVGEREGSTLGLLAVFEAHGVSEEDIDLITVGGTTARLAALESGEVVAAALSQPAEYQAVDSGYNLLGHTNEGTPQITTVAARVGVSPEKDAALTRFLRALVRAAEWISDPENETEVIDHWVDIFEMSEEHAKLTYDLYQEIGSPRPDMELDLDLMVNYLHLYGGEFEEHNLEEYYEPRLLEDARASL